MSNIDERRRRIIEYLCNRRHETLDNLAFEFGVSKRTIRYDIEILSRLYPIYTVTGTYGGIYILDGYRLDNRHLTDKECGVLERLAEEANKEDKIVIYQIIKTFSKPKVSYNNRREERNT